MTLLLLLAPLACAAEPIKVTFVNPGFSQENPTGNFWKNVSAFMDAAADDLNIELTTLYADRNHIVMKSMIKMALTRKDHYLIFVDEKSAVSQALLASKEVHNRIVFLLNTPDKQTLIRLKSKGFGILGSIVPDNHQAGRLLIQKLDSLIIKSNKNPTVNALALLGESATDAARQREQGLLSYSNRSPNLKLQQRANANWSEQEAYTVTKGLLARFTQTKLIWAANDAMAKGAARAAKELSLRDYIYIGGINWDEEQDLLLDASIGGHVTLGALLLVYLNEHHSDNSHVIGHRKIPIFKVYEKKYAPLYNAIHSGKIDKIDFRYFSRLHTTPAPKAFTLDSLTNLLK